MRLFILSIAFFCVATFTWAQADSVRFEYCKMRTSLRDMGSTTVHIELDLGEKRSLWKNYYLRDEAEEVKQFNSIVDALNFMGTKGWEVIAVINVSAADKMPDFEYLMKRKVSPEPDTIQEK